ncbi:MAG: hypothetical protein AVDCRST_MAG85-1967, partial [uncultured Solirubrobacteraceae bacterium]
ATSRNRRPPAPRAPRPGVGRARRGHEGAEHHRDQPDGEPALRDELDDQGRGRRLGRRRGGQARRLQALDPGFGQGRDGAVPHAWHAKGVVGINFTKGNDVDALECAL